MINNIIELQAYKISHVGGGMCNCICQEIVRGPAPTMSDIRSVGPFMAATRGAPMAISKPLGLVPGQEVCNAACTGYGYNFVSCNPTQLSATCPQCGIQFSIS